MNRWLELALILSLFWVVFFAAWYAFYGHGWQVGVVFGLTIIATIYSVGVTIVQHMESKVAEKWVGLGLAHGFRLVMVVTSIIFGMYFIVMDGVRLFG